MLISVSDGQMFYFVCFFHVLAHFVLVLQVGVKNILNHNNHVLFYQLRDLTAHQNYHEHPIYLYTKIRRLFQCMFTCLLKILCLILGQLWHMFFILDLLSKEKLIQFD